MDSGNDTLKRDSNHFADDDESATLFQLQPYILLSAKETGKEIRRGPFTIDVEVTYKGIHCIGKKLSCDEADKEFRCRFDKQCSVLSELRHPHIEHFLGIFPCGVSQSPMIVTEFMPYTLTDTIEQYKPLPEEISYSILHDISLALRYLHERVPPIAHRGLSASSVLVEIDMTAKLSDVGVVDILNLTPLVTMQRMRTAVAYMAPEALEDKKQPQHATKIDTFSYGVLALHVISGNLPMPDEADPNHQSSEAALRKQFLNEEHPLADLTRQCLSNSPESRPNAAEIQTKVSEISDKFPHIPLNKADMIRQIDASLKNKQGLLDEIKDLSLSNKHKEEEIQRKDRRLELLELSCSVGNEHDVLRIKQLQAEVDKLKVTVKSKKDEIRVAKQSAEEKKQRIEDHCEQYVSVEAERWKNEVQKMEKEYNECLSKAEENCQAVHKKQQDKFEVILQEKKREFDAQLQQRDYLLQRVEEEKQAAESSYQSIVSSKELHLQQKDAELSSKDKELQHKNEELCSKDKRLREKDAELLSKKIQLQQKDAELSSSDKKLRQKDADLQKKDAQLKVKDASFKTEKENLRRKYDTLLEEEQRKHHSDNVRRDRECKTEVRKSADSLKKQVDAHKFQLEQMNIKQETELKEKEAIIEAKQAEVSSRDTEIEVRTTVLAGLHQQLDHLHSTVVSRSQVHPLNMNASLNWNHCTEYDLPIAMAHAQAVVVNGELYIGGGETDSDETNCQLYKYTPVQQRWSEAYPCPVRYFGLGKLSQQPVLVGGVDKESKQVSNTFYVFDDASSQKHLRAIAPMPTARSHPCVVSHQSGLIVAGGCGERAPLTTVELFKDATQQWYKADPLPTPFAKMTSATINDTCYLMGGEKPPFFGKHDTVSTRLVVCAPISTLLKKAIPTDQTTEPDPKTSLWNSKDIENTPHRHSAAVNLGEMLLAVAGDNSTMLAKDIKQTIYAYCPTSKNWLHIADLPKPCTMCTAVALPSQEILIIGGKDNNLKFSKVVYKGSIQT